MSDRSLEEGDWIARQFFSVDDFRMSPEEYAAHHAHHFCLFSLHRYRYADPVLGAWIRRLGEILTSTDEVERCRRRFLRASGQNYLSGGRKPPERSGTQGAYAPRSGFCPLALTTEEFAAVQRDEAEGL
jgi:hypothetical protein